MAVFSQRDGRLGRDRNDRAALLIERDDLLQHDLAGGGLPRPPKPRPAAAEAPVPTAVQPVEPLHGEPAIGLGLASHGELHLPTGNAAAGVVVGRDRHLERLSQRRWLLRRFDGDLELRPAVLLDPHRDGRHGLFPPGAGLAVGGKPARVDAVLPQAGGRGDREVGCDPAEAVELALVFGERFAGGVDEFERDGPGKRGRVDVTGPHPPHVSLHRLARSVHRPRGDAEGRRLRKRDDLGRRRDRAVVFVSQRLGDANEIVGHPAEATIAAGSANDGQRVEVRAAVDGLELAIRHGRQPVVVRASREGDELILLGPRVKPRDENLHLGPGDRQPTAGLAHVGLQAGVRLVLHHRQIGEPLRQGDRRRRFAVDDLGFFRHVGQVADWVGAAHASDDHVPAALGKRRHDRLAGVAVPRLGREVAAPESDLGRQRFPLGSGVCRLRSLLPQLARNARRVDVRILCEPSANLGQQHLVVEAVGREVDACRVAMPQRERERLPSRVRAFGRQLGLRQHEMTERNPSTAARLSRECHLRKRLEGLSQHRGSPRSLEPVGVHVGQFFGRPDFGCSVCRLLAASRSLSPIPFDLFDMQPFELGDEVQRVGEFEAGNAIGQLGNGFIVAEFTEREDRFPTAEGDRRRLAGVV